MGRSSTRGRALAIEQGTLPFNLWFSIALHAAVLIEKQTNTMQKSRGHFSYVVKLKKKMVEVKNSRNAYKPFENDIAFSRFWILQDYYLKFLI